MRSPAAEMQTWFTAELVAEGTRSCRKSAASALARLHGITIRRFEGIARGEVGRVWADEFERARAVYRDFLAREQERALIRADQLAREKARLDAQDAQDGIT